MERERAWSAYLSFFLSPSLSRLHSCLSSVARLPRGLIVPMHVPLRTQDSSVTRPGDMGTSSAKVNGLLRTPDAVTLDCLSRRGRQTTNAAPFASTANTSQYLVRIDAHVDRSWVATNARHVFSCYVALRLDILRSARISCRVMTCNNASECTRRNDGLRREDEICLRKLFLDQIPQFDLSSTSL